MGLLSWITGADRAAQTIDKVSDGLFHGLDKLKLTEEERLDYGVKAGELWLETQKILANENTARTLTRRYMAVAIIYIWLFMVSTSFLYCVYELVKTGQLVGGLALFTVVGSVMGVAVLTVIAFYYGPAALAKVVEKIKK